mgnify:CR=1 FL=1
MTYILGFLGRLLLSLIFLFSSFGKLLNWDQNVQYLAHSIQFWQQQMGDITEVQEIFHSFTPLLPLFLLVGLLLESIGSLLLLTGFRVKLGAFLLFIFLVPATVIFHPFWAVESGDYNNQLIMFLKNLAILGGLIMVLAQPGKISAKPAAAPDTSRRIAP